MNSVATSLNDIFRKHRLVFWYDPEGEMRAEFMTYESGEVEKIDVKNDQFGLKQRVMREAPKQRFLLYMPYPRPAHAQNWFLDLELGHHLFHADGVSLVLQELGWQEEHRAFVEEHRDFYNSQDRKTRLLDSLHKDDGEREWRLKMLSVLVREEPALEACLLALLTELAEGRTDKWEAIGKYGLDSFFWDSMARVYDYRPENPSLLDFAIEVFVAAAPCGRTPTLGREARVFLGRWKDSNRYRVVFETLSKRLEGDLKISKALNDIEGYAPVQDQDAFEAIEQKIIVELRDGMLQDRTGTEAIKAVIDSRERSYWYPQYQYLYDALLAASTLMGAVRVLDLNFETVAGAIHRYTETYFRIDQLYRQFRYSARKSGQATLLHEVAEEVERRYNNDFLLRLNDRFQGVVDQAHAWPPEGVPSQRRFFHDHVYPFLQKKNKLFVIVSDALRFEVAEELNRRILREDRFRSKIGHQVGVLPSYTQLGMAALLPHDKLEVVAKNGEALVDGHKTMGLEARKAVLAAGGRRATAVKAQEFLQMNAKEEGRALFRDHDLIYIYQNGIDHTGDKRETEGEVFDAVEREFETLLALMKKVAAVNGTNILITADHGFLYQNVTLDESEFTENPTGTDIGQLNRRYAIGSGFEDKSGSTIFTAGELGLQGEASVAIPKSINRYRVKGAGSRYVHGGASLQEVVLPVLVVNKARKSDTEAVEVDVLRGASNLITVSQATLSFLQEEPAREKLLGRTLRIGFYAKSGESLSGVQEVAFESAEADPRLRERKLTFPFSKVADRKEHQNTEIFLRLEERIAGTNQFRTYKEFTYRLKKAFETDFEL